MNVSKRLALSAVAVTGVALAVPAMADPHNPQGGKGGLDQSVHCKDMSNNPMDGYITWSPTNLWPPNHKYVPVSIHYTENSGDNDGDTTSITVSHVTEQDGANAPQDATVAETMNGSGKPGQIDAQPHGNAGDATTGSDTKDATYTEDIRAERSGTDGHGSGRTYDITVTCTDTGGSDTTEPMMGTADIFVTVPHDQGVVK